MEDVQGLGWSLGSRERDEWGFGELVRWIVAVGWDVKEEQECVCGMENT